MSFIVPGQRTRAGEEFFRHLMFGAERPVKADVAQLKERTAELTAEARAVVDKLWADFESLANHSEAVAATLATRATVLEGISAGLRSAQEALHARVPAAPFRLVLMGRTMAGKSTLFEYLSQGDGARVGEGGQRTTRESCVRASSLIGLEIVDTPGVGALDGEDDFRAAFAQLPEADLIVWVATDQATQEQTGRALTILGDVGKPIIVALNCLADVTQEDGLLDLLEEPELIFGGDAEGNLGPIRRYLEAAGSRFLAAVPIHAQAALHSQTAQVPDSIREKLLRNSRIEEFVRVLADQRDKTAAQRRAASICDAVRPGLLEVAAELGRNQLEISAGASGLRGSRRDLEVRASQRIDDAQAEMAASFSTIVGQRERWIENVDVGEKQAEIQGLWVSEVGALKTEVEAVGRDVSSRLATHLVSIAEDIAKDLASVEAGEFSGLEGYGSAWGNRATKYVGGVGLAVGGPWVGGPAGAYAGAAVGSVVPVLGTAVGAVVGFVVGGVVMGAIGWLSNRLVPRIADKFFRTEVEIRERRRGQLREQFSPLLVAIRSDLADSSSLLVEHWRASLATQLIGLDAAVEQLEVAAQATEQARLDIETAIAALDLELCRQLLVLNGRPRAAGAVTRATRWRGAGIAADLPDPDFSELILFPLEGVIESIVPVPAGKPVHAVALQVLRGLSEQDLEVHEYSPTGVRVAIGPEKPQGVVEAWQALASTHAHTKVAIDRGDTA